MVNVERRVEVKVHKGRCGRGGFVRVYVCMCGGENKNATSLLELRKGKKRKEATCLWLFIAVFHVDRFDVEGKKSVNPPRISLI